MHRNKCLNECFKQREKTLANESVEEKIGRVLGKVGPSMLLTSTSESIAFFVGTFDIFSI